MQTSEIRNVGRRLLANAASDFPDMFEHGQVVATRLAEFIAWYLEQDGWLDDETHPVWDVALDLADAANRTH